MKKIKLIIGCIIITLGAAAQFPSVQLSNISGGTANPSMFNRSDDIPVVIAFWATWCIPCINELTTVNDNLQKWKQEIPFELVAVSVDDSRTANRVQPFVNGKGWDFTVLSDKNQELKRALNISNVPYTVIVKNGKIIYRHSGFVDGDEALLFKTLKDKK